MGESWANNKMVQDLFASEQLAQISKSIAERRKALHVFPSRENVFRAFRETPLERVSVVMLGQD